MTATGQPMTPVGARRAAGVLPACSALLLLVVHVDVLAQPAPAVAGTQQQAPSPAPPVAPARTLADLIAALIGEAPAHKLAPDAIRRALAGFERDPEVTALATSQPEQERTTGAYLGLLVTEDRIAAGREKLTEHAGLLDAIERRYGVDRHVLVAVWGIESRYGASKGTRDVIRSLATLALEDERRPDFWRRELLQAIAIRERGDIPPEHMVGSWAGAMGHTQFMPSTFNRLAVDFDGDGRRDLWGSVADALASTAAYLAQSGWQRGEQWGLEVRLPAGFDYATAAAPGLARPVAVWRQYGITRVDGAALPEMRGEVRLAMPAGARGPAFLVTPNFRAILRYNPALSYALAVAHLADRLAGGSAFVASWPQEPALTRGEREELQRRLAGLGFETGGVDGVIGNLTRAAIRSYQKGARLVEDGHPSVQLLERLRAEAERQGKTE